MIFMMIFTKEKYDNWLKYLSSQRCLLLSLSGEYFKDTWQKYRWLIIVLWNVSGSQINIEKKQRQTLRVFFQKLKTFVINLLHNKKNIWHTMHTTHSIPVKFNNDVCCHYLLSICCCKFVTLISTNDGYLHK